MCAENQKLTKGVDDLKSVNVHIYWDSSVLPVAN